MGEDMRQKTYVKSVKSGQYVNAHEICEWNPDNTAFDAFLSGRNYDAFSLFGSRRGNYRELKYANYGIPDFLKGTIFEDYMRETGRYGFIWFKYRDFKKAVDEYLDEMLRPWKRESDDDECSDWKDALEGSGPGKTEQALEKYRVWLDDNSNIISVLKDFQFKCEKLGEFGVDSKELIDMDETIFLFYFD